MASWKTPEEIERVKKLAEETGELIPGMREQGKGIKSYVKTEYAPAKAVLVGNPNMYCCDCGLIEGIAKVGGEDLARHWKILPSVFMHFQTHAYDKTPTQYTLYSGKCFKRGDYVELLAHDDLLVAVSLCPLGDQEDMSAKENLTVYPVKCKILEGADGPLETAPAPQWKSRGIDEYIDSGFKTTPAGRIGDKNSPTAFK